MSEPVVIEPYSPGWALAFERERDNLRDAFARDLVDIEHVGSTSVPGMAAKPIIDILLGAPSLTHIEERIGHLQRLGYRHVPEYEDRMPERRYFVKPAEGPAKFHLHAVERSSEFWRNHIAFRDALRGDRAVFEQYLDLKRRLAELHRTDRGAYTDAKQPFIRRVVNMRTNRWRVAIESVDQPEAIALVRGLDAHLEPLYPPDARHGLNLEALRSPQVLFVIARDEDGVAHGCGALALSEQHAELKRMYVRSASRGLGAADSVVGFLEGEALRRGYDAVVLETGIRQPAAISFYERIGYVRRGPFGKYVPNGFSVFMEKRLRG